MKYAILLLYSLSLWYWFIEVIQDEDDKMSAIDKLFAFFPPLSCSLGIIGWLYFINDRTLAQIYLVFFLLGVTGLVWQLKGFLANPQEYGGALGIVLGVPGLSCVFGPGIYYGFRWITI